MKVIILTHQDFDHIGSLPDILRETNGDIEVYAHLKDKPYTEGKLPLMKVNLDSLAGQLESLPEEERLKVVSYLLANLPKGNVNKVLAGGEELLFCGGISIIFTPGHISLYLKESKTLVAGDSMYSVDGKLMGIHQPSTPDMVTARCSLKKYLEYDIESVLCYHGGYCNENVSDTNSAI